MTSEIIRQAVTKAINNGFDANSYCGYSADTVLHDPVGSVMVEVLQYDYKNEEYTNTLKEDSLYGLIYNHDFAKALWDKPFPGTNIPESFEVNLEDIPAWQYHLMQMVIADDPIRYLADNM